MLKLEERHFPFVIAVVSGEITNDDIDLMTARYAALHERKRRFFLAQEVRQVALPNAPIRRRLADLNAEFTDRIRKNIVGIGIVVPSRLVVAAMTAVYWISQEASPTKFLSSAAELVAHARNECAQEKLVLPPSLEALAARLDVAHREQRVLLDVDLDPSARDNPS